MPATPEDFGREFLDMIIAAQLVDGVDGAIAHIRRYGSQHTEAILTENDADGRPVLRTARQCDPDAQCLHPVRRWWRVRDGGRDRHRDRQAACARAGRGGATDQLQIPCHRGTARSGRDACTVVRFTVWKRWIRARPMGLRARRGAVPVGQGAFAHRPLVRAVRRGGEAGPRPDSPMARGRQVSLAGRWADAGQRMWRCRVPRTGGMGRCVG